LRPFSKASEKSQGSGLGLFVCQEFFEKIVGGIACQSQQGKGTRVTVKIPAAGKAYPSP
jgi:hypothetical protein